MWIWACHKSKSSKREHWVSVCVVFFHCSSCLFMITYYILSIRFYNLLEFCDLYGGIKFEIFFHFLFLVEYVRYFASQSQRLCLSICCYCCACTNPVPTILTIWKQFISSIPHTKKLSHVRKNRLKLSCAWLHSHPHGAGSPPSTLVFSFSHIFQKQMWPTKTRNSSTMEGMRRQTMEMGVP